MILLFVFDCDNVVKGKVENKTKIFTSDDFRRACLATPFYKLLWKYNFDLLREGVSDVNFSYIVVVEISKWDWKLSQIYIFINCKVNITKLSY